jgi:hypothetical protein
MLAGEGSEADCSEGRSKRAEGKGEREEGRGPGAGLGSDRPGWPGHAPTPTSESDHRRRKFRLEEGTNQSSEPARRWDRERGPWETDHAMRAEFRRLGGPAGHGGGQRAVTK